MNNYTNERLLAQLKQRFTSEVLWHFAGRRKTDEEQYYSLLSILKNGLKVGEKNEEFKFIDPKNKKFVSLWGYPVSCLADIPLKDLLIHAERYGKYAIGFHKESAIDHEFMPVLYVNQFSGFFRRFIELRNEIENYLKTADVEISNKFEELLLLLGSIAKSGNLKANPINDINWDDMQVNNFYYEREWRSLRDWDFRKNDVAIIILPDERIENFTKLRNQHDLRIDESIPVLSFSMIHSL